MGNRDAQGSVTASEERGGLQKFLRFLAGHGLRLTPGRRAVAEIVLESLEVLSADEIRDRARGQGRRIGLSTVYKTLSLLETGGFVGREPLPRDGARAWGRARTGRLVCSTCDGVAEFRLPALDEIAEAICRRNRMHFVGYAGTLVGTCASCADSAPEGSCPAGAMPALSLR